MTRPSNTPTRRSVIKQVREALKDTDGWWVEDALARFRFLETDFGFELSSVSMHFRGNSITYRGETSSLELDCAPEEAILGCMLYTDTDPELIWVPSLLKARDPTTDWEPPRRHGSLTRTEIDYTMRHWADGLRRLAPDILRGVSRPDGRNHQADRVTLPHAK